MSKSFLYCLSILVSGLAIASCSKDDDDIVSQKDRDFMIRATYTNLGEAGAGNIAIQYATSSAVTGYGNMMVTDHSAAQSDLLAIAGSKKNISLPAETDQEHKDMAAMLMTLQGNAFDSTYLYVMVAGHDKAIALYQEEIQNGRNEDVRQYASDKLVTIQHHRAVADSLAQALFP